jgi:hypothetical protein
MICYRNVYIHKCAPNSSGMRYYCHMADGQTLRADTLDGIRRAIRVRLA